MCQTFDIFWVYLHASFRQIDFHSQILSGKDAEMELNLYNLSRRGCNFNLLWVMSLCKRCFELLELLQGKSRPIASLFPSHEGFIVNRRMVRVTRVWNGQSWDWKGWKGTWQFLIPYKDVLGRKDTPALGVVGVVSHWDEAMEGNDSKTCFFPSERAMTSGKEKRFLKWLWNILWDLIVR